jgi:hypothetical protein
MTGELLPESQEKLQEQVQSEALIKAEELSNLLQHPGWKQIKEVMEATIKQETHSLLFASNLEYIVRAQAIIRARKDLLDFIEMKLAEGKALLDESKT